MALPWADMAELADALDLGSSGRPCRFKSCYPQDSARERKNRLFVSDHKQPFVLSINFLIKSQTLTGI